MSKEINVLFRGNVYIYIVHKNASFVKLFLEK